MEKKDQINKERIPQHVAVIMDGNGRWARRHGLSRTKGHEKGVGAVRDTVEAAAELGIRYLTLFAFSTENWKRPRLEVDALMTLLLQTLGSELENLNKNKIRLIPQFQCLGHQSWERWTFSLLTKHPEFDETPGKFPQTGQ